MQPSWFMNLAGGAMLSAQYVAVVATDMLAVYA